MSHYQLLEDSPHHIQEGFSISSFLLKHYSLSVSQILEDRMKRLMGTIRGSRTNWVAWHVVLVIRLPHMIPRGPSKFGSSQVPHGQPNITVFTSAPQTSTSKRLQLTVATRYECLHLSSTKSTLTLIRMHSTCRRKVPVTNAAKRTTSTHLYDSCIASRPSWPIMA